MKVTLKRQDEAFHFEGTGLSEAKINIDGAVDIGGGNKGARPTELILMGLGGCAAIDVVLILKKQKQVIEDFSIEVTGEKKQIEGTTMKPFKEMNIHFILTGNLNPKKVERAINLSTEKYCTVSAQLSPSATITTSFEIITP